MPNQLARFKRRQSLAEHEVVLAALAAIARREQTTVMALLREAARAVVKARTAVPAQAEALRPFVARLAPQIPKRFKTPAQVARFKRVQREFDQVILDLNLTAPATVQARNSLVPARESVRLIDFDRAHAAAPAPV